MKHDLKILLLTSLILFSAATMIIVAATTSVGPNISPSSSSGNDVAGSQGTYRSGVKGSLLRDPKPGGWG